VEIVRRHGVWVNAFTDEEAEKMEAAVKEVKHLKKYRPEKPEKPVSETINTLIRQYNRPVQEMEE